MRSPDQQRYPLFRREIPEPYYGQFKIKPLRPGPRLYYYKPDEDYESEMEALVEAGVVRIGRRIGSQKPRYKEGQLVEVHHEEENTRALAIILKSSPEEKWIDLQVVEETHEQIRPLSADETERFDRHEGITLPAGGVWLPEAETHTEGIPVPDYLGGNFREFFFTIRDAHGFIRVAQGKRSGTELTVSRAD